MRRLFFVLLSTLLVWNIHFGQKMSDPVMVSDSPDDASKWGQVAFGPDGKVHFCWVEDWHDAAGEDIFYISYDGIKWDGPENLTKSRLVDAERPYICTSETGGIFIAYDQGNDCYLIEYDPIEKKWLDPVDISYGGRGGNWPSVAADPDGNVYVIWMDEGAGRVFSRTRINGEWEDIERMSSARRSKNVSIAAGKDGQVWAVWRERIGVEYKIYYSKRTKSTEWSSSKLMNERGASQARPHVAVGPDNVPVVTYFDVDAGEARELWICTIDEDTNPREKILGGGLRHIPKIAIDSSGNIHLAWQIGPGDFGLGIGYMNNIGGNWNPFKVMPNSGGQPVLPGIASDKGGNVALSWSSTTQGRDKEVWFSSLYPVLVLYPPINLSMNISVKNLTTSPEIVYDLSWEPNPENDMEYVQGYNIYKKENGGDWELLLTVNESTSSATFTFTNSESRVQFGIKTVSTYDTEGPMGIFGE